MINYDKSRNLVFKFTAFDKQTGKQISAKRVTEMRRKFIGSKQEEECIEFIRAKLKEANTDWGTNITFYKM